MKLEIELDYLEGTFEEAVAAAAARQLLHYYVADEAGDSRRVPTDLERRIRDEVLAKIEEEARAAAPDVVRELLEQGVRRTNTWGDPSGELVSLKTVIAEEVRKELTVSSGHRADTALSKLLKEEVERELKGELKGAVEEAKAVVVRAVGKEAREALEGALRKSMPEISF